MQLAAAGHGAGRAELAQAVADHQKTPDHGWDGLLVALRGQTLKAALWVQPLPGNTAQLWPPRACPGRAALLRGARRWVRRRGFALCQAVLGPDDVDAAAALKDAGMMLVAPLEYLTAPVAPAATTVRLGPWDALDRAGQIAVIADVQKDSLDCVALCETLGATALLTGFYQQDDTAPAHWSAVYLDDREPPQPVGALLLAPRPAVDGMEVLLMGLAPEARGQGLGRAVLDAAFARAHAAGARRLLLSVDTTNTPARRLYARAGFVGYAQRHVYAWLKRSG